RRKNACMDLRLPQSSNRDGCQEAARPSRGDIAASRIREASAVRPPSSRTPPSIAPAARGLTRIPRMPKPRPDECDPYSHRYIHRAPEGDVVEILARQPAETASFLARFRGARAQHRYAPGKWSVKEVVGHMVDTDRVFGFRAFHVARGDHSPLPSMEQDD